MLKHLVVNGDDFGYTPSVSEGIVEAFLKGILTSTTIMSNIISPEEKELLIKTNIPSGLHFNLTDGKPLSKQDSKWGLVDINGNFNNFNILMDNLNNNKVEINAVKAELHAQLEACGFIRLTHLDSHKHIHQHPFIFRIITEKPFCDIIKTIRLVPFSLKKYYFSNEQEEVFEQLNKKAQKLFNFTKGFAGYNIIRKVTDESVINELEIINEESAELMVHPGFNSPKLKQISTLNEERESDLRALLSQKLKDYILHKGISSVSFGEINKLNSEEKYD